MKHFAASYDVITVGVSHITSHNIVYVLFELGLVGLLISMAQRHLPYNFCCYMDFHWGVV